MILRMHEISEAGHRILNPFTDEKLMLLGEVCRLVPGQRQLDLACGKGEMLCRWAARFGIGGVGIDISEVFLGAARDRARELGVDASVRFEQGDASVYVAEPEAYDVVSCIGDPEAPMMREFLDKTRRSHLTYGRRYLGWGVFVLRPKVDA